MSTPPIAPNFDLQPWSSAARELLDHAHHLVKEFDRTERQGPSRFRTALVSPENPVQYTPEEEAAGADSRGTSLDNLTLSAQSLIRLIRRMAEKDSSFFNDGVLKFGPHHSVEDESSTSA